MLVVESIFWLASVAIVYVYFGYPLLLYVSAIFRQDPLLGEDEGPVDVTLIISAFNEADVIAQKVENSLSLDYPADRFEVLVVSDASDDGTDEIVDGFDDPRVTLLRMEERGGKTLGLNAAVEQARGDVLVFSDANAMYQTDAVQVLVRGFGKENVGAVVGESTYSDPDDDAGASESLYWRYETRIKQLESATGSVVGGDGAIYAIRRELYRPMRADALSDFVNPCQIVQMGYRCLYDADAISVEEVAGSFEKEFRRKVRIVNRAWRALMSMKGLLNPFRYGFFSFKLVSHKLLRWIVPVFLLAAFLSNIVLVAVDSTYWLFLIVQLVFYSLAALGAILRGRGSLSVVLYVPYYFCLVNYASAVGIFEAYKGNTYTTWTTART